MNGIYMASSVAESCALYPALIEKPEEVADEHGGVECLRRVLPAPTLTKANTLYWFTDRTPHESLPMREGGMRQFFRLVVGPIGVWYAMLLYVMMTSLVYFRRSVYGAQQKQISTAAAR